MKKILISILFLFFTILLTGQTIITIDDTKTYQVIDGWEATSNSLEAPEVRNALLPHIDSLIALAVDDLGITRLRYGLKSGVEDSTDYFTQLLNGLISYDEYKLHRYSKINDNNDPFLSNPNGFQLSGFKDNLEKLIIPFKNKVESNGDRFYLNLCFVDFVNQSSFHHTSDPEEYAELIEYAWSFMEAQYGFTPDGLEIILEPDNAEIWNKSHIPPAIASAGDRLLSNGYSPEIISPSVLNLRNVPAFFNEIVLNPKALDYLDVICYHRYSGNNDTLAQQMIVDLARQYNKKTAMLEYDKNGDVNELHYDLKYNNVVAWTKYALMYKSDEKFAYVYVDLSDEQNPEYGIGKQSKYLRQYFKYIRPGATRIEAFTSNNQTDPVSFVNSSGNQVVVIKSESGDSIIIQGLKPGDYGISYTLGNYHWSVDPKSYDIHLDNQTLEESDPLIFTLPDQGVATVFGLNPSTTSVKHHANDNGFRVFPNPATSSIIIEYQIQDSSNFSIHNLSGVTCLQGKIEYGKNEIDIRPLSQGVYMLQVDGISKKLFKY